MSHKLYDVAIIGGGIYGASVARDAALRGLSVALVDKGDFGNATSANSHKIIHGGLRYLQHGDLRRMRESIRERSTLMKIAPHLVFPMPFLIPTNRRLSQGKLVMALALKVNDLIGFDRNRHLYPEKTIPSGRLISKSEFLEMCPNLDSPDLTGGAIYYDGQLYNANRFLISTLSSANQAGADLANYVEVTGLLKGPNKILGLQAKDIFTTEPFDIKAKLVINCSGPWVNRFLNNSGIWNDDKNAKYLKAMVLVTRQLIDKVALGIPGKSIYRDQDAVLNKGYRFFFITPWRNRSLIGTFQRSYNETVSDDLHVSKTEIHELLHEINSGYPGAHLKESDVYFVYVGLLPKSEGENEQLVKQYTIYDHQQNEGLSGLLSVTGVKYTTARDVAERVVDLALQKLDKRKRPSQTAHIPLAGGQFDQLDTYLQQAVKQKPREMTNAGIEHLVRSYGSDFSAILEYGTQDSKLLRTVCQASSVTEAEIVYAVRREMALKLSDVVFRRTDLGASGYPGSDCLKTCGSIMSAELGWSDHQFSCELEEVRAVYRRLGIERLSSNEKVCAS